MRFQEITSLALKAAYVESDWFDQRPSLKFAIAVTNRNELFASTLEQYGHYYEFKPIRPNETHVMPDADKETKGQIDLDDQEPH